MGAHGGSVATQLCRGQGVWPGFQDSVLSGQRQRVKAKARGRGLGCLMLLANPEDGLVGGCVTLQVLKLW